MLVWHGTGQEWEQLLNAIHNNHTEYDDGIDCCDIELDDPDLGICPAHRLLMSQIVMDALLALKRRIAYVIPVRAAVTRYNHEWPDAHIHEGMS